MEKYGVQESPLEKTATEEPQICPNCGTKLSDVAVTGVLKCPKCGTKPFEEKPSEGK
jgi:DNA-directed RNA polymerase subunit RPC12/RpoP